MLKRISTANIRGATDAKLSPITQDIIDSTQKKEAYAEAAAEVEVLANKQTAYIIALGQAEKGGKDRTDTKNKAKQELVDAAEVLAEKLEKISPEDDSYYVQAGYELKAARSTTVAPIDNPISVFATSSAIVGVANLVITIVNSNLARTFQIEYRIRGTQEWIRKDPTTKTITTVIGLPREIMVFRVRVIGSGDGNLSDWITSNEIPIL